jgi:hypothetical protein
MFVYIACALCHIFSAIIFMTGMNKSLLIIPLTIGFSFYVLHDSLLLFLVSESRFTILRGPILAIQVLVRMLMNILFDLMYINADGEIDSKTLTSLFYTLAVISFLLAAVVFLMHFKEWIVARFV